MSKIQKDSFLSNNKKIKVNSLFEKIKSKKSIKSLDLKSNKTTLANNPQKLKYKIDSKKIRKPKTIKKFCEIYKKDILGKPTPVLYKSCEVNKFCRKNKCGNIDNKFQKEIIKKLGSNYYILLMSSVNNKCPSTQLSDKIYKRCYKKATKKFYTDMDLGNIYNKVLECDTKTCKKEKDIFHTNLYRIVNKNRIRKTSNNPIIIEDIPDKEMIEIN